MKHATFAYVNHARIRSWNQPVPSNEGQVSCSSKQQEPLMGLELGLTGIHRLRVRRTAHCIKPPSFELKSPWNILRLFSGNLEESIKLFTEAIKLNPLLAILYAKRARWVRLVNGHMSVFDGWKKTIKNQGTKVPLVLSPWQFVLCVGQADILKSVIFLVLALPMISRMDRDIDNFLCPDK